MTHDERNEQELIQRRQKARAIVMAVLLLAFVALVFFITIVKIKESMAH